MNSADINRIKDNAFKYFGVLCTLFGLFMLSIFIGNILLEGFSRIDWQFITSFPSRNAAKAGILPALVGTLWIMGLTIIIAIPNYAHPYQILLTHTKFYSPVPNFKNLNHKKT